MTAPNPNTVEIRACAVHLTERFAVRIGAPQRQPLAMRDFVIFDPSGVLWRVAQNIPRRSDW